MVTVRISYDENVAARKAKRIRSEVEQFFGGHRSHRGSPIRDTKAEHDVRLEFQTAKLAAWFFAGRGKHRPETNLPGGAVVA
jgi:hypothetical protein